MDVLCNKEGSSFCWKFFKTNPFTVMKSQLPGFKTYPEKKGDIFIATSNYQRAVKGCSSTANRQINQLYRFIGVEKTQPQEQIQQNRTVETLATETGTQLKEAQDEFYTEFFILNQ